MQYVYSLIFFVTILSGSCVKQQPQLPANKSIATDSSTLILQQLNEKLIEAEDSLLTQYVAGQTEKYEKSENGYWFRIIKIENKKLSENREVSYSIYSLENELLISDKKTILPGKKELISAIDHFVFMHPHVSHASLIIPWYQAYGVRGQAPKINAYQSVKAKISIIN
ncbi:MAG: hypothetical protein JXR27_07360 [Paludibacteraceae bacterium]|nr:hypothetical protein [Paludibacteraceae bacterium]